MDSVKMREAVEAGKTILGIEFGSTRIKAVLTNEENAPIAQGAHDWEIVWRTESGRILLRISGADCRMHTQSWQQMLRHSAVLV